jgi:hypothetical protein
MRRMYHARYNFFAGIPGAVHKHTEEDAFAIWIRGAPPRAARVYVIPEPRRNLAQVSVFDAAGQRLFSHFSP